LIFRGIQSIAVQPAGVPINNLKILAITRLSVQAFKIRNSGPLEKR
jgi:hypothetical protein